MGTLHRGGRVVGEVSGDGAVYRLIAGRREHVAVIDGFNVIDGGGLVGSSDAAGNIFDATGTLVGTVTPGGDVTRYGRSYGYVRGCDPRGAGAALVLVFIRPDRDPPQIPGWLVITIGLLSVLFAIVAVLFAAFTAFIWLGMVIVSCVTALVLSGEIASSVSPDELAAVEWVEPSGKIKAIRISQASLKPYLRPFPFLFLAVSPAIAYGIAAACISLALSPPSATQSNGILEGIAMLLGILLSAASARAIMRARIGLLLVARYQTVSNLQEARVREWNKVARYAAASVACLAAVGASVVTFTPKRLDTPSPVTPANSSTTPSPPGPTSASQAGTQASPPAASNFVGVTSDGVPVTDDSGPQHGDGFLVRDPSKNWNTPNIDGDWVGKAGIYTVYVNIRRYTMEKHDPPNLVGGMAGRSRKYMVYEVQGVLLDHRGIDFQGNIDTAWATNTSLDGFSFSGVVSQDGNSMPGYLIIGANSNVDWTKTTLRRTRL